MRVIMNKALYSQDQFKDNCGFGLIAHIKGEASYHLLKTAIQALTCMTHRGGINADGKTGDGCGLLLQKPDKFLQAIASEHFQATLPEQYAVGMVFLSNDEKAAEHERQQLNQQVVANGLKLVGWREVPTDPSVLGQLAADNMPRIEQVFITGDGLSDQAFGIKLFFVRRRTEIALKNSTEFYICSLSHKSISYKGLMMPADLEQFYPDLKDERMATAICLFHQRFSTNTMPRWRLAQPFRFLAHNGEINTITGNRNWAISRRKKFNNPLLPNLEELEPIIDCSGSDSASMDNMLELLITGGMDLFRGLRMMIPPAWQNVEIIDADLRSFYEFNSIHMEPWDGPAGLC